MISPVSCPICNKPVTETDPKVNAAFPFCSVRCRDVDFFRWCNEEHKIVDSLTPEQLAEKLSPEEMEELINRLEQEE